MVDLVITDSENPEQSLEIYINHQDRIFINVGQLGIEDEMYASGFITLDKNDALALVKELKKLASLL